MRPKRSSAARDEPLGRAAPCQVGGDVQLADPAGAAAGRDDARALGLQLRARPARPIPPVEPVTTHTLLREAEIHRVATVAA